MPKDLQTTSYSTVTASHRSNLAVNYRPRFTQPNTDVRPNSTLGATPYPTPNTRPSSIPVYIRKGPNNSSSIFSTAVCRGEEDTRRPASGNQINPPSRSTVPIAYSTSTTSGILNNAHDFIIQQATFIEGINPNEKLYILARNTILGAQFDSGERDPPPSCHPGTRLDISGKLVSWMCDTTRNCQITWLHGPAGVGKSAVIQTLAESEAHSLTSILGATIFFSRPNNRNDPQRIITTIAYQLAVKLPMYRAYIAELLTTDPFLVKKSMAEQFKWFIVKPFAENMLLNDLRRTMLIILDGLDECNGERAQREFILLVARFSRQHPSVSLIWIIASRPEPQICAAFSHQDTQGSYFEIDMPVDSDQACTDVESYLRDRFAEIRQNYYTSFPPSMRQWPTQTDFTKIGTHASGLFAFATAVVRFIEDQDFANPIAQLQKVLSALEFPSSSSTQDDPPFATLDTLYSIVLSGIPPRLLQIARRVWMVGRELRSFALCCNALSITQADAYGAFRKLHSVLDIPPPEEAPDKNIRPFHASFSDYLRSRSRSGSFWIDPVEAEDLLLSASIRILLEAHNTVESVVSTSNISMSWPEVTRGDPERELFHCALSCVLRTPPKLISPLEDICRVFQDIDYSSFGSLLISEYVVEMVARLLKSPLLPHLKERGVITTAPIQSLNLAFVSLDDEAHIFSDRSVIPEQEKFLSGVFGSLYHRSAVEGFFHPNSKASRVYGWHSRVVALCDNLYWKNHVDQHLAKIIGLLPTLPVTLIGKGNKCCILIPVEISGKFWAYLLPYRPS